jgi:sugar phosphate isomerase/epimerase
MLSLSTSWNSQRHQDGREVAREARELGFEWIEISHGTRITLLPGLLDAVKAGEIRVSSLHNFCPPPVEVAMDAPDVFEFTSARPSERERAINLTQKTLEMANRFGADRVVLHMGSVRMKSHTARLEALAKAGGLYSKQFTETKLRLVTEREKARDKHLSWVRAALDAIIPECEKQGVKVGIETRSHYEQIPNQREMALLLKEYQDCPWVGAWHDFGHVQRQANLALLDHEIYLCETAPRLLGCHVHDVEWPARDHRVPLSTGGVDFTRLLPLVPAGVPLVWELSPRPRSEEILSALADFQKLLANRPKP